MQLLQQNIRYFTKIFAPNSRFKTITMFEYIIGKIKQLTPTYAVLEAGSIGYMIHISVNTFEKLQPQQETLVFIHEVIREDMHALYGFAEPKERELFRLLISVSGIGPNTARIMLSSLTTNELQQAVLAGDVPTIKSVKGIGLKTAQRVIIDLKDKIGTLEEGDVVLHTAKQELKDEAIAALLQLGFAKMATEKMVDKLLKTEADLSVEALIKKALKLL